MINATKCSVEDCEETPVGMKMISINNAPKEYLPVCEIHADAADEDEKS
jgi:hypothetical protein